MVIPGYQSIILEFARPSQEDQKFRVTPGYTISSEPGWNESQTCGERMTIIINHIPLNLGPWLLLPSLPLGLSCRSVCSSHETGPEGLKRKAMGGLEWEQNWGGMTRPTDKLSCRRHYIPAPNLSLRPSVILSSNPLNVSSNSSLCRSLVASTV